MNCRPPGSSVLAQDLGLIQGFGVSKQITRLEAESSFPHHIRAGPAALRRLAWNKGVRTGQLQEGSPEFSSQWLACHICSPRLWAPQVFRRTSVKSAVESGESSSEKQDVRTHTHTHTHTQTQHSSTKTASGETVSAGTRLHSLPRDSSSRRSSKCHLSGAVLAQRNSPPRSH